MLIISSIYWKNRIIEPYTQIIYTLLILPLVMVNARTTPSKQRNSKNIKLPRWIKEDPEAGDKGTLLYIEEWAKTHQYSVNFDESYILTHMVSLLFSCIALLSTSSTFERISIIIFFSFLWVIDYLVLGRDMPFCIYENGLTDPKTPFKNVFKRRERFIPWNDIHTIGFPSPSEIKSIKGPPRVNLVNGQTIYLHYKISNDPLQLLRQIHSVAPTMIEEMTIPYLDDNETFDILLPERSDYTSECHRSIYVQVNMTLFAIPIILGMFFTSPNDDIVENIILSFIFSVVIVGSLIMYVQGSINEQFTNIKYLSKAEEDGLHLSSGTHTFTFKEYPDILPWKSIKKVEMILDPKRFFHVTRITLGSGEEIIVPIKIYEFLEDHEDFSMVRPRVLKHEGKISVKQRIHWDHMGIAMMGFTLYVLFMMGLVGGVIIG